MPHCSWPLIAASTSSVSLTPTCSAVRQLFVDTGPRTRLPLGANLAPTAVGVRVRTAENNCVAVAIALLARLSIPTIWKIVRTNLVKNGTRAGVYLILERRSLKFLLVKTSETNSCISVSPYRSSGMLATAKSYILCNSSRAAR